MPGGPDAGEHEHPGLSGQPEYGADLGAWTSTPLGSYIAVEIGGNFPPILPQLSLIPNPLPMTATAMMLCEAN